MHFMHVVATAPRTVHFLRSLLLRPGFAPYWTAIGITTSYADAYRSPTFSARRARIHGGMQVGTAATELLALRGWLPGHRVTHVAMECTGGLEAGVLRPRGGIATLALRCSVADRRLLTIDGT